MRIATYQMSATTPHPQRQDRIVAAMHRAADGGADLLVAPELALSGYGRGDILRDFAQSPDGEWAEKLGTAAVQTGVGLVTGFPERSGASCHISALIIDPAKPGAPRVYRKSNLYGAYERGIFRSDGASTVVFPLAGLNIGVLICFDVEFPENARRLAMAGADLIVVPTALPKGTSGAFIAEHMVRVRACENGVFLAYVNHADADEGFVFQGMSSISAPDGSVLAMAAPTGEDLLFADIDPSAYTHVRDINPYLSEVPAPPEGDGRISS